MNAFCRPILRGAGPVAVLCAAAMLSAADPARAETAVASIGTAVKVDTVVTGGKSGDQPIAVGDKVFTDDRIVTNLTGVGQIEFLDGTKLAVGPGSTLTLDRFVYDPKKSKTDIVMGFGKGTFRFITGKGTHTGYELVTPTATIGVRGTAFDTYVDDQGDMTIAMIDGEVEVCSRRAFACQTHNAIGRFLHLTRDGVFSIRDNWDDGVMKGVSFAAAMPFMVNDRVLRPAFRASGTVVRRYANATKTAVGNAAEGVGKAAKNAATGTTKAVETIPDALRRINPFRRK